MKSRKEKLLKPVENREDVAKAIRVDYKKPMHHNMWCVGFVMFIFCVFSVCLPAQELATSGKGQSVLVIPVYKDIESGLSFFIQRQLRRAESENISTVILEISSNGGRVDSAQEIKDALLRSKVTTVAYIKGRALSAAALIAISCHRIYMEPGSEIGAATPVMLSGGGIKAAEEKFVSAFKAEFRSSAEARNRPTALAEAMVDKNHDTIEGLCKRGEILTLTSELALNHGYCDRIVSSLDSILRAMNLEGAKVERSDPTWAEKLARYLTNPNISTIIFTIGFWCLIAEFFVAGFGVLGITGIICMALFFGGHLFAYLAGLEAIILFVIGFVLLLLEILVIPGFGVAGVAGILAISSSIIIVFGGIYTSINAVAQMLVYSAFFLIALYKFGPKFKLINRFVLKEEMSSENGCIAVATSEFDHLLDLEGITLSPCRPSGKIKIGDERYDAASEGDFIERDSRIVVKKVEGSNIIVRELKK